MTRLTHEPRTLPKKRSYRKKRSRSKISESSIDFSSLKNKCANSRFTELPKSCANFPSKHRQKVADAVSRFAIDEPKNKTIPKLFIFPESFPSRNFKNSEENFSIFYFFTFTFPDFVSPHDEKERV